MQRLLFITLSNIGDGALITPMPKRMQQCYPRAVFGTGRPLRYHPRGPQCARIVTKDQNLDSLSAHSVAERLRTRLKSSANVRRN